MHYFMYSDGTSKSPYALFRDDGTQDGHLIASGMNDAGAGLIAEGLEALNHTVEWDDPEAVRQENVEASYKEWWDY
jgi:hypothetical protein